MTEFGTSSKKITLYYGTQSMGQDSLVGIVTSYVLDGLRIKSRWRARFSALVQTSPGTHTDQAKNTFIFVD
jgi:hypothetical protein